MWRRNHFLFMKTFIPPLNAGFGNRFFTSTFFYWNLRSGQGPGGNFFLNFRFPFKNHTPFFTFQQNFFRNSPMKIIKESLKFSNKSSQNSIFWYPFFHISEILWKSRFHFFILFFHIRNTNGKSWFHFFNTPFFI